MQPNLSDREHSSKNITIQKGSSYKVSKDFQSALKRSNIMLRCCDSSYGAIYNFMEKKNTHKN